jgi:hypothetical protein
MVLSGLQVEESFTRSEAEKMIAQTPSRQKIHW